MAALESAITGLAILLLGAWCFCWFMHIVAMIYGKWKFHRKPPTLPIEDLPGVSILKPLCGIDPHLYENLETYFSMDYPLFEILFCIDDEMDPAIMIINSLLTKYPKVDARLFIGGKKVGINPKINNMITGYDSAKYDLVMVSDSGIKMKPDTLLDMAINMTEDTGLVHQMPYVCERTDFAGTLETVYFGTQHAKMYLSANLFGINCATGMSCLMRKDVIEEAGGLRWFGQYLAEDFFLAQAFVDRGWKLRLSSYPAMQNHGTYSVASYQARMVRWIKLRSAMIPHTIFLEPISECMMAGLLSSWAVSYLFDWSGLCFMLVHILIWFMFDYILLQIIQNGPLPFPKVDYLVSWIFRECTSLFLMMKSHADPLVTWRTKKFRIRWGGVVEEVKTKLYV